MKEVPSSQSSLTPDNFLSADTYWQQLTHRASIAAKGVFVALEVNPLTNEGARVAALAATQMAFENPGITAGAFAAATFAIEASGAAATASLLETKGGRSLTAKLNSVIQGLGLQGARTNLATDAAISMVAGAPAAVLLKHGQDPQRTKEENMRFGLISSLGITAVSGAEGWLISKGITHPDPVTIGGALLGAGAILGGVRWIKERLKGKPYSYDEYSAALKGNSEGPQLKGYQRSDFERASKDRRTRHIPIDWNKKKRSWPVLAPIEHNTEYLPAYFENRYGADASVYYLSLPPRTLLTNEAARNSLRSILLDLGRQEARVVFDEIDGEETASFLRELIEDSCPDAQLEFDDFVDPKNDTPAAAIHFAYQAEAKEAGQSLSGPRALVRLRQQYQQLVESGEVCPNNSNTTILLDPKELDQPLNPQSELTVIERLWEIYSQRFDDLIENFPVRGKQTFEELETMLRDPNTYAAARVVDGEIVAFTMFVNNIEACDWLDADFYRQKFSELPIIYFPGIASDETKRGSHHSLELIKFLTGLVFSTVDKVEVVFQCTNVSARYIPRIVGWGINKTELATVEYARKIVGYNYRGLSIRLPESDEDV